MIDRVGFQAQIPVIKNNLLGILLNDDVLVKLLADTPNVTMPAYELRYTHVFPWEFTMGTTTDARAYITFETAIHSRSEGGLSPTNPGAVDVDLYVYAFCHDSIMRIDDAVAGRLGFDDPNMRGSRIDLMCARIDQLLNGRELSSFGRFEFSDQQILNPLSTNYHGKCNIYNALNANRWGRRL